MADKKKNYKTTYLWLWLLLAVGLAVVCGISFYDHIKIGPYELSKGTFPDVIFAEEKAPMSLEEQQKWEEAVAASHGGAGRKVVAETDTSVKSVLIFGDSMTILVANRLAAYGEKNGYSVASVTWDGSSSISWSSCDTLENYIARYKPDFIFVTLGSNELFLKNFDSRRPYVEKLVAKMQGIPFVWIGPPNWKEDVGFNEMMLRALPAGTYYDSNVLDLPRGADHIHPTFAGGITWTDSIMSWMAYTPHPIPAVRPDAGVKTRTHNSHYFKAGKGKGDPQPSAQPATQPSTEETHTKEAAPAPEEPSAAPAPAESRQETESAAVMPADP